MNDEFLAEHGLPSMSSPKWRALNHLAVLPYFRRVWIIQETRLATSCTLLWGACWISLSDFVSLIPWLLSFCFTQYDVHTRIAICKRNSTCLSSRILEERHAAKLIACVVNIRRN
jgi:hypothetical protein